MVRYFFGIYRFVDNNWYNRIIDVERRLVLNYDIMPDQIIIGVKVYNWWFIIFRDKWNKKIKFIFNA